MLVVGRVVVFADATACLQHILPGSPIWTDRNSAYLGGRDPRHEATVLGADAGARLHAWVNGCSRI